MLSMHGTGCVTLQQTRMATACFLDFAAMVQLLIQLECVIVERDEEGAFGGCKAELGGSGRQG